MDSESRSPAGRTATRINGWTCTRRCRMERLSRCCRPIASHRHAWTNPTPPIRRTAARSLRYGRRTFEMGTPTRVVLVILDLATGESTEIPGTSYPYDTYDIGHPRWSPDGTRIAFHVVEGPPTERRLLIFPEPTSPGPSSIYVVGTDGSGLRQLTPVGVPAGDPDWSPGRITHRLRSHVAPPLALRPEPEPPGSSRRSGPTAPTFTWSFPVRTPRRRAGRQAALRSCSPNKTAPGN